MLGPDQTAADWGEELSRALGFGTGHLSLYQLTIEPGTRFATDVRQGAFAPMADDPAADLFALTRQLTVRPACPPTKSPTTPGPARRAATT